MSDDFADLREQAQYPWPTVEPARLMTLLAAYDALMLENERLRKSSWWKN